jgi:hypothetical protein
VHNTPYCCEGIAFLVRLCADYNFRGKVNFSIHTTEDDPVILTMNGSKLRKTIVPWVLSWLTL